MVLKKGREAALNLALVFCVLAATVAGLRAQGPVKAEVLSARTINMSVGSGQELKIDVFRWSTDDQRNALLSALNDKADSALTDAIEKAPSLGTIWTNENLGYTIRYAYRDVLPNGVERVIIVTDRRLGSWSGQVWKAVNQSTAVNYPFSLIELHLNRNGTGEGKMSLTTKVAADAGGKTLVVAGYDAAPVLLRNVKRESGSPSS